MDDFSLKEKIRIAVLTEPAKSWPTYDGQNLKRHDYVTASEAISCVRKLAFQKHAERQAIPIPDFWDIMSDEDFQAHLDAMKDDDVRGIFARGNWIEEWIVETLQSVTAEHEQYFFTGKEQVSFYTNKKRISGTPDGLYVNWEEMSYRWLEFKSTQNVISGPKMGHVSQLSVNTGISEHLSESGAFEEYFDIPLSSMDLKSGRLLYVNADNYLTMSEFEVEWDQGEALGRASAKAKALFIPDGKGGVDIRQPEDLKPEGMSTPNGCSFCGFYRQCKEIEENHKNTANAKKLRGIIDKIEGRAKAPKMPEFNAKSPREEVVKILINYAEYADQEKDAKDHKEALKDAIISWAETQPDMRADFQDGDKRFRVTLSKSERKGGIDDKKLEEFLAQHDLTVDSFRKDGSTTTTLRVTVKDV